MIAKLKKQVLAVENIMAMDMETKIIPYETSNFTINSSRLVDCKIEVYCVEQTIYGRKQQD